MDEKTRKRERRLRKGHERLRTTEPACAICGEHRPPALEGHHPAGRKFGDETGTICKNDHAVLTKLGEDHPPQIFDPPHPLERIAHGKLGLADLFEVLIPRLREDAMLLLDEVRKSVPSIPDDSGPKGDGT